MFSSPTFLKDGYKGRVSFTGGDYTDFLSYNSPQPSSVLFLGSWNIKHLDVISEQIVPRYKARSSFSRSHLFITDGRTLHLRLRDRIGGSGLNYQVFITRGKNHKSALVQKVGKYVLNDRSAWPEASDLGQTLVEVARPDLKAFCLKHQPTISKRHTAFEKFCRPVLKKKKNK